MTRNGFTLVELIVVIAVMALMAGAVVLTMGPGGSDAAPIADRFASRVAAARDSAVVDGRPTGVWVTASGYGFEQYRGGGWQPLTAKPFEGRDWGKGIAASVAGAPGGRVRFDTMGLPSDPLAVTIGSGAEHAVVRVAANGDVVAD